MWWQGADGLRIQGFLVPPRAYDPARRYPLLVRLHGGPQQMFGYAFRNELAIFSGAGYFVLLCNPRGSSGYGQAFADASRADWGGQPVEDIRRGVRHVLEAWPAIDPRRVGAWGGSYGGYVVNWLQGHNDDGLFAALASHAGSADRWSAWGTTEELWFPEWEMLGPPWEQPDLADRWSPIRYAESFRTPQLITHGDRDYRVRVSGAEAMFTALQRRGVPSRMLRFPDEGHWIQKPHNQQLWYRTVLDWFDEWLQAPVRGPGGDAP
ncbi:MAG: S9 family peptidase [Deltaproteobacteria bacterium]|nr:S9 family peptidase [Deltaproteobacteria bacterium]